MYTAKLSLKLCAKIDYGNYQDRVDDILYGLISAFVQNGQIADCRTHPNFIENECLCAIVNIFNNDSLDKKYHNIYINKILSKLKPDELNIEILGKEFESLDIATPNSTNESPIRSFEFDPIPIHYLPKTHQDNESYYNLICWQKRFSRLRQFANALCCWRTMGISSNGRCQFGIVQTGLRNLSNFKRKIGQACLL